VPCFCLCVRVRVRVRVCLYLQQLQEEVSRQGAVLQLSQQQHQTLHPLLLAGHALVQSLVLVAGEAGSREGGRRGYGREGGRKAGLRDARRYEHDCMYGDEECYACLWSPVGP